MAVYGESNARNLTIQCEFLTNSDAKGCMVEVLLLDDVENISINVTRTGGSASACHVIAPFYGSVTEVFAYDIEYDGTVGVNPISDALVRNTSVMLTCNNSRQSSDSVSSKNNNINIDVLVIHVTIQ